MQREKMMNGHTPGPWKAVANPMRDDGMFVVRDVPVEPYKGTGLDGQLRYPLPPAIVGHQVDAADAYLIAAAPDLLEALRNAVVTMTALGCDETELEIYRASVAKAEGR